jgi:small subunit ribosomal protein S5e
MSDAGETIETYDILPKEVTKDVGTIKLFGRWDYVEVEVRDISLTYV